MSKRNWKPIIIGMSIFAALSVLGISITFVSQRVGKNKELSGWSHGKYFIKECPVHGGFPLLYDDKLPRQYKVAEALGALNKEVNAKIPMGPIWEKWKGGKTARHVVPFAPAPKIEYTSRGKCHWSRKELGWMETSWENGKTKAIAVYLCVDIIEDAYKNKGYARYWKKTGNQKLKEYWSIIKFGRFNMVKHEGGHGLWGTHPVWDCGLMCANPRFGEISSHAIDIVRKHVYPVCKKNNLLNLKQ